MKERCLRALVVGGSPEPSSPSLLVSLAHEADFVVAADRGADACRAAGVVPDAFCGDADSICSEGLAWVREQVGVERIYPSRKDDTDLSLALRLARDLAHERGGLVRSTVTCASGGRIDHALGVFGVLSKYAADSPRLIEDAGVDGRCVRAPFECRVLSPEGSPTWDLDERALGHTFSFVGLSDGSVTSLSGMRWELDHFEVAALADRGISNVVTSSSARVACHRGRIAAFLLG